MIKLELKVPPLILAIAFGIVIYLLPNPYRANSLLLRPLSLILFGAGGFILLLAILKFRDKKTTVSPVNPHNSNQLVTEGVYKYTRNPMYLGFLIWLLSLGTILGNPASLIILLIFVKYMNTFQIIPEERILFDKFGEDYLLYKKSVPRWFCLKVF